MARRRSSLRRLHAEVAKRFPDISDPAAEIAAGRIVVDGYGQLRGSLRADQRVVAVVKPQYELGLEHPPRLRADRRRAVAAAEAGLRAAGWIPLGSIRSPVPGSRGAVEHLVHARRGAQGQAG